MTSHAKKVEYKFLGISEKCLIKCINLSMSSKACAASVNGLRTWCLRFDCSSGRARFHIVTHPA